MTFEEFFTKKRIDLALLRQAKPALYEEFRDHYAQMSEKSFDHTKKYWFNRLRKDFLLEVVEAPKAVIEKPPVAKAAGMSASAKPAAKPAGFKPRFKAGGTSTPKPAEASTEAPEPAGTGKPSADTAEKPTSPTTPTTKPTGFKPRFKAGVTKPATPGEPAKDPVQRIPTPESETPKAGSEPKAPQPNDEPETPPKPPGFKPRFKAGKTTNKNDDTD